jgi:hypothetical protein
VLAGGLNGIFWLETVLIRKSRLSETGHFVKLLQAGKNRPEVVIS